MQEICTLPIASLQPFARNPRTHSDEQVKQIVKSIEAFGWTVPILIDGENSVIAGHGRLLAAKVLGLDTVPTISLDHLTSEQVRAYRIADNRLPELGEWDTALLSEELNALKALDFDVEVTGFSLEDMGRMQPPDEQDAAKAEETPEPPKDPISKPSDIWTLGDHRVVCGDNADPAVTAAVMRGQQAHICVTSPPYAQQRDYGNKIKDWDALMCGAFSDLPLVANGQILVNLGLIHRDNEWVPYWDGWIAWMREQGWRRFGWYVWDQGRGMMGDWHGRLAPAFEFLFHFNKNSRQPNKIIQNKTAGDMPSASTTVLRRADGTKNKYSHVGRFTQENRIPSSVLTFNRANTVGIDHPAVFPVNLPAFLMDAYTNKGETVYDPFCGSGTTLIAAERQNRRCFAIEIDPAYCDVIVQRWEAYTGKQAERVEAS